MFAVVTIFPDKNQADLSRLVLMFWCSRALVQFQPSTKPGVQPTDSPGAKNWVMGCFTESGLWVRQAASSCKLQWDNRGHNLANFMKQLDSVCVCVWRKMKLLYILHTLSNTSPSVNTKLYKFGCFFICWGFFWVFYKQRHTSDTQLHNICTFLY